MDLQIFQDFYDLGITAIPIQWNEESKKAIAHPERTDVTFTMATVADLLNGKFSGCKGIAINVTAPLGMVDFDHKNTTNKNTFTEWFAIIKASNPDVLSKICITKTRNDGYHVYFKNAKLDHKIPVARECDDKGEPQEVISIYTGGLLSYDYPTPGYSMFHNDWNDIDFITDDEFDLFVSTAALFNKYEYLPSGESVVAFTSYPSDYESTCLQFDRILTDELFDTLLQSIGLKKVKDQRRYHKKGYVAYLRDGSKADYSAKAYFKSKKLLIFSGSMSKFPTWNDAIKGGDKSWSLTPSKIVFYKNEKNWTDTIAEINCICESAGLEIEQPKPITQQPLVKAVDERAKFPYDILPESITNYIQHHNIQPEYMAAATLVACSTSIGNTVQLEAIDGYIIKPIMYLAIVAPPGASKSPALKKIFAPLEKYDSVLYAEHLERVKKYRSELADAKKNKTSEPEQPQMQQLLIKDSTIEMVIKILSNNKVGCTVLADELSGFLKRMNQYKDGDEVQKWLELWSGSPVLLQRISRDENKVQDPYCNIIGGIQPGVLESLSKDENQHNGFYHRFLFCYPEPQTKADFTAVNVPIVVRRDFLTLFQELLSIRLNHDTLTYQLTEQAFILYKQWFDYKNTKYNISASDNVKGIIAKYQDYCLRFSILLQVMNETERTMYVSERAMNGAIRLTEYFFANMHKALKLLAPETPLDKLSPQWQDVYNALPTNFTTATFVACAGNYSIKPTTAKSFLVRQVKKLFAIIKHGEYEKML